eukprot:CAMPEP_0117444338 /NCGR_PEP_ID=MMETSP0759-20121206/5187_1 /TAXON_ID=63605 /ORGANISM="Percolomonas cosmopolitus, Strain WS" /LENGTH=636 /DNA_ID=CAMNT_0005236397 /DNA_START=218 /DNA_END=2128 /DNA_ORIENTATION=-
MRPSYHAYSPKQTNSTSTRLLPAPLSQPRYTTPTRHSPTTPISHVPNPFSDETNTFIEHFQEREHSYDHVNDKIRHNGNVKPHELPRIGKSPYAQRYGSAEERIPTSPKHLFPDRDMEVSRSSHVVDSSSSPRNATTTNRSRLHNSGTVELAGASRRTSNPYSSQSQSPSVPASRGISSIPAEMKSTPSSIQKPTPPPVRSQSVPSIKELLEPTEKPLKVPSSPSNAEYNAEKYNDSIEDMKQTTEWIQQTLMSGKADPQDEQNEDISIIEAHGNTESSEEDQEETEDAKKTSPAKEQQQQKPDSPVEISRGNTRATLSNRAGQEASPRMAGNAASTASLPQNNSTSEEYSSLAAKSFSPSYRSTNSPRQYSVESRNNISTYSQYSTTSHSNYSNLNNTTTTQRRGPCLIPGFETPYNIDRHTAKCSAAVMSTHLFLTGDKQRISSSYPSRLDFFKHGYQTFWSRETTSQERRLICRWMKGENVELLGKDAAWQFYKMIQRAPRAESSFMVYQVVDAPPVDYKIEEFISQGLFSASWHPDSIARVLQQSGSEGKTLLCLEIPRGEPFLWLTNDLMEQSDDRLSRDFVDKRRQLLFWIASHQLSVTSVKQDCLCAFLGGDRETEFRVTMPVAFARLR